MQKERPLTQEGWALGTEHYTALNKGRATPNLPAIFIQWVS